MNEPAGVLAERRDRVLLITINPRQGEIAGPVMTSEDAREGATAFAAKRAPGWKGR
jgi:hypothetical protein